MDELKFKVSAEIKNILGRDLITSDNIAILELVKNSYDAHATKVEITFDDDKISIADNGKGMSKSDVINKWLFLGYSAKRDGTEDSSYRSNFKRNYAGSKGIGRMSCDRLSRYVTMTTKSVASDTVETIEIDWEKFENHQTTQFTDVSVKHSSSRDLFLFPQKATNGTMFVFRGVHGIWDSKQILSLRKSLEKMINPFSGKDDFIIEIIAPNMKDYEAGVSKIIKDLKEYNFDNKKDDKISKYQNLLINGIIKNSIADTLKIKTTKIDSKLENGKISTQLIDRGEVMYDISEDNKFDLLKNVSISIYYLNRSAKYSFTLLMGTQVVNYGNIFLFRNRFRIFPYGEPTDDSWGLNQRAQQGFRRHLSTRDLIGRVDVETDNVDDFKEGSSRDNGLIENNITKQLFEYFNLIVRRLERYVTGVLWGEAFLRKDYFKDEKTAIETRQKIESDKDSDNTNTILQNIGSKVDFLQLVKSLVNDDDITVEYYNSKLTDIVSDFASAQAINKNYFEDLKILVDKLPNKSLAKSVALFEEQLENMRRLKESAERKVEALRKIAEESENKRKEVTEKLEKKEKELDAQKQMNIYLSSTQKTSPEVLDLMHAIALSSNDLNALIDNMTNGLRSKTLSDNDVLNKLDEMSFHTSRIIKISNMLTKADIVLLSKASDVDLKEYIKEYLFNFENSIHIVYGYEYTGFIKKLIPVLELSIVLDNLVSNSKKAGATEITIDFYDNNNTIEVLFSDNGCGVDLNRFTPESIFDLGVTDRRGGSGIGLSTIRKRMDEDLNGEIEFIGNGMKYANGAAFKLKFY